MELLHIYTQRFGDVSVILPGATIAIYFVYLIIVGILAALIDGSRR